MANHLNMAQTHSIEVLLKRGWSQRRVARDLGIDRGTVSKVFKRLNAPEVTSTTPSKPGPPAVSNSACQPHHDRIQAKLELGLSAERIFSDLRQEVGFEHSYQSVKRYVRKLKATPPKRVWRMECAPGEEAQIDFGFAKTLLDKDGKQRMSNVLRITLSHSRKGYTETLPAQSTDHFLTAIENAFRHFGGVPATLRIDNLKAAVKQADWYDPELHPKILAFAEHYQTTIIPTRPYTPEHKGKVESDVNYVKINALKGHQFSDIASQNAHLRQWEETVADQRIHGTTKQHVLTQFQNVEKPALRSLPSEAFHNFQEAQRTVHRDSYIELARSYYEVPPEYIGHQLWIRWDTRLVRVFDTNMQSIIRHLRLQPGNYSRVLGARGSHPTAPYRTTAHWIDQVQEHLGNAAQSWAVNVSIHRSEQAPRILQGLINLKRRHCEQAINQACQRALDRGQHHLSDIKQTLSNPNKQTPLLAEHPLIRSLQAYQQIITPTPLPSNPSNEP
jgi:transposase